MEALTKARTARLQKELRLGESRLPFVFGALSDRRRFLIFRMLLNHRDLCVTDIAHLLGVSVPAASQQLKILELSGLVQRVRMGQMCCYEVRREDAVVQSLLKLIHSNDSAMGGRNYKK